MMMIVMMMMMMMMTPGHRESGGPRHHQGGQGDAEEAELEGDHRVRWRERGPGQPPQLPHALPGHQVASRGSPQSRHARRWNPVFSGKERHSEETSFKAASDRAEYFHYMEEKKQSFEQKKSKKKSIWPRVQVVDNFKFFSTNKRLVYRSWGHSRAIRGQYLGHLSGLSQSEARNQVTWSLSANERPLSRGLET